MQLKNLFYIFFYHIIIKLVSCLENVKNSNQHHNFTVNDIDKKHVHIVFDNLELYCKIKSPPLSHSWSYECEEKK